MKTRIFYAVLAALVLSWTAAAVNLPDNLVGILSRNDNITIFSTYEHNEGFRCTNTWHVVAEYNRGNHSIVPDHYGCWQFSQDKIIEVRWSDGVKLYYSTSEIHLADWFLKQYPSHGS